MFALFNPPHVKHKKRKSKKNAWFGNTDGHRAAAKRGWAKRKKKHGKKLKRASELRTPGGGRIFSMAANNPRPFWPRAAKRNHFMGINPIHKHTGGHTMSRKRRGGRRARFNFGFTSPKSKGMLDGLNAKNLVGVAPIFAGVVANGILTKVLGEKIPYTSKGIGNIALGLASAGVLGMATRYASKPMGDGVFVGGVVGVLGCAFKNFMEEGLKSLSLGDYDDINPNPFHAHSFMGMGQFVSPQQITGAIPSGGTQSQYSLPNSNAQWQPGAHHHGHHMHAQLAPPQTPMQAHTAGNMSDYEGSAIGSVLGQDAEMMGM